MATGGVTQGAGRTGGTLAPAWLGETRGGVEQGRTTGGIRSTAMAKAASLSPRQEQRQDINEAKGQRIQQRESGNRGRKGPLKAPNPGTYARNRNYPTTA